MKLYDGYDAHSPTLVRSPRNGDCLRGILSDEYPTILTDRAAPICSGDFVRLWIAYPDGDVRAIVKRLRVSRSGTWWAECADGVFQIGALVQPFNVEKVVGLDTEPLVNGQQRPVREADEKQAAHFAELARDVVEEWATLGHVNGVPFPGLRYVNFYLTDGVRNPDYMPPVAL